MNMERILATLFVFSSIFMASASVVAGSYLASELLIAQERINKINILIPQLEVDEVSALARHKTAKRAYIRNEKKLRTAKKKYDRASKNSDIVSHEQIKNLLDVYSGAKQKYNASGEELRAAEKAINDNENDLRLAQIRRVNSGVKVLEIKSRIYENKLKQTIWVEGRGECILGEDKTIRDCQKLARSYAEQNAIEKGSKAFIETLTEIKDFELVRDEIRKSSSVIIIAQDNTGGYGQIKRVMTGGFIKYHVTVRLKIEGVVGKNNPFEEKIRQLKADPAGGKNKRFLSQNYDKRVPSIIAQGSVEGEMEQQEFNTQPRRVVKERSTTTHTKEQFIPLPGF